MKPILVLYIIITPAFFKAQTTHYFNKRFDENELVQGFGAGITTHDGNHLLVGVHIGHYFLQNHLWLIELDENGDTVQTSSIYTGDSSTLYTGRNIVQYDFGQDKGYFFPIGRSDLNTGNANTSEAELYKVGADLKVFWKKKFGGNDFDTFDAIALTSKNELVMAGQSCSFGDPNYGNAYVVKTDTTGNQIWKRSIGVVGEYVPEPGERLGANRKPFGGSAGLSVDGCIGKGVGGFAILPGGCRPVISGFIEKPTCWPAFFGRPDNCRVGNKGCFERMKICLGGFY